MAEANKVGDWFEKYSFMMPILHPFPQIRQPVLASSTLLSIDGATTKRLDLET